MAILTKVDPDTRISFHHTRAYPGCPATLADEAAATAGEAVAEFSDGSMAMASYRRLDADTLALRIAPHTTARRAHIPAKAWKLARGQHGAPWKATAKLDQ